MSSSSKPTARHAVRGVVRGDLEGVGFRDATRSRAQQLGLLGWVRTSEQGEGLIHAEGSENAVAALVSFLRSGPAGATIDEVEVEAVEPEGHEQFAVRGVSAGRFEVVAAGGASRFELRLEVEGEMRRWALPRGPSMDPAVKRMAFEAAAAETSGVGEGRVWDEGPYEQGGRVPWPEALVRGHAVFVLHGAKLSGGFALQRIRSAPKAQWLLIKRNDGQARRGSDVVADGDDH